PILPFSGLDNSDASPQANRVSCCVRFRPLAACISLGKPSTVCRLRNNRLAPASLKFRIAPVSRRAVEWARFEDFTAPTLADATHSAVETNLKVTLKSLESVLDFLRISLSREDSCGIQRFVCGSGEGEKEEQNLSRNRSA